MRGEGTIADVATAGIERIQGGIVSGHLKTPLSKSSLVAFGVSNQLDVLSRLLSGHSKLACVAILQSVLDERNKAKRATPELVWTGPEGAQAQARDTAVVLKALFKSARKRVVLAGYSFWNAESVLKPLQEVMVEHGVDVRFFVDIPQPKKVQEDEEAYGEEQLKAFLKSNWPFSTTPPALYCDRRALRPGYGADFCSLHAKCVSVDSSRAFVSSANFTLAGQNRNIETGVLLDDPTFARQLDRQLMSLVEGNFVYLLSTSK